MRAFVEAFTMCPVEALGPVCECQRLFSMILSEDRAYPAACVRLGPFPSVLRPFFCQKKALWTHALNQKGFFLVNGSVQLRSKDYISQLAWERLGIPPEELVEVAGERAVWAPLLRTQISG